MSVIKSKSEDKNLINILTINEIEENMMKNKMFEMTINNIKNNKGFLLKIYLGNNYLKKILLVFYEGTKEEIYNIKIINKYLKINEAINIDNSREAYFDKYFAFIEIQKKKIK